MTTHGLIKSTILVAIVGVITNNKIRIYQFQNRFYPLNHDYLRSYSLLPLLVLSPTIKASARIYSSKEIASVVKDSLAMTIDAAG